MWEAKEVSAVIVAADDETPLLVGDGADGGVSGVLLGVAQPTIATDTTAPASAQTRRDLTLI